MSAQSEPFNHFQTVSTMTPEASNYPEYECCRLCPRQCGVNRNAGKRGHCGASATLRIAAFLPHFGEEPSLVGTRGSGTVFFGGCSCGCFFCQNHQISQEDVGKFYTQEEFTDALRALVNQGVQNLNFVTPGHYWPNIRQACLQLRSEGITLPFLWNSSGYEDASLIPAVARVMDVFLPDFKFSDPELAERCMGDARYPELALNAIAEMVDRHGFLRPWDTSGEITASTGTLVRHLVLPGQFQNSIRALDLLYEHFGPLLPISLMSQFMPMPACRERHFLDSKTEESLYQQVCQHAIELGFQRIYAQEGLGDDRFAPDFTKPEPFGTANRGK
ncbi:MAG: radical SAM protein [Victivallales bacterium]|nr:radical SAM protein [Victivallales bacterium]